MNAGVLTLNPIKCKRQLQIDTNISVHASLRTNMTQHVNFNMLIVITLEHGLTC